MRVSIVVNQERGSLEISCWDEHEDTVGSCFCLAFADAERLAKSILEAIPNEAKKKG